MDRLFLRHNGGHRITVEGNAQLGRGRGECRRDPGIIYRHRPMPPDFGDLTLVIEIDGSNTVSRIHAGIRREGETYTIEDLHSSNGTFRNGVRMTPGIRYPLAVGDILALGKDVLLVGETPESFANVYGPAVRQAHTAVLRSEWYLGIAGFEDDRRRTERSTAVWPASRARSTGVAIRPRYTASSHPTSRKATAGR